MKKHSILKTTAVIAVIAGFGIVMAVGAGKASARMYPGFGGGFSGIGQYTDDLDLTPDQEKQFKELIKSERAKFEELAEKHRKQRTMNRDEMEALRDSTDDAARKILTPEQQKKLKELQKNDRNDFRRGKGMMRDGFGPGKGNCFSDRDGARDRDCYGPGCGNNNPDCGYRCAPDRERARDRDCYGPGCGNR